MLAPMLIWYAIFHYGPMYGIQLAFKDFYIMKGIWGKPLGGFQALSLFICHVPRLLENHEEYGRDQLLSHPIRLSGPDHIGFAV